MKAHMRGQGWIVALRNESGATAAILAVLLGTGALLGMLALSFDIGLVYLERRTVQSGADAAVDAVAQKCALRADQCQDESSASNLAGALVNANAEDSLTSIEELCGAAPLAACEPLSERYADCREKEFPDGRSIPADIAFVRVTTSTQTAQGSAIRTVFSDVLDGQAGDSPGITLWSCAQAVWGKVAAVDVRLPIAFGACEYELSGSPVVTAAFPPDPQPGSRLVPTTVDCANDVYATSGGVFETSFAAVANGFAPVNLGDATCTTDTLLDVEDVLTLSLDDLRTLCGGNVGAFATFLDGVLASDAATPGGLYLRYPVVGAVTQESAPNSDQVTFDVLSFASYRILGYSLKAPGGSGQPVDYAGGQVPPGGWGSYPAGSPVAASCAQRSCLYGQFANFIAPRDRISTDAAIPNMGVQAVESLP